MSDETIIAEIERAVEEDRLHLNDWEDGFIESMRNRLADGFELTTNMDEQLRKIWEKAR